MTFGYGMLRDIEDKERASLHIRSHMYGELPEQRDYDLTTIRYSFIGSNLDPGLAISRNHFGASVMCERYGVARRVKAGQFVLD